ncbi:glucose-6-phosphate isomerase [Lentisphaerota bacterium ZTH]|nr:glucose-6-phosphate isomerase [Lentisphaerota bacterium]WET06211.1 glucose-6-phosphate isomerase [Lentisphaerota bacterium ZTH]
MQNKRWIERNHKYTLVDGETGFSISFAGMKFEDSDLEKMAPRFERAAKQMTELEAGAVKNPDENRKVTHFSDRIEYPKSELFTAVEDFAEAVRSSRVEGAGGKFESVVINGIGGSALGPQLMQFAINGPFWNELTEQLRSDNPKIYFLDNTDPAGFADVAEVIDPATTLVVTISKSGGTQETRNNMIAFESLYAETDLDFSSHAVAITMKDSQLWKHAEEKQWLQVFEMAESIGGRTSETSIVGHLPAALAGIDFAAFLEGACHMDQWTRCSNAVRNPAYMLAAMWYIAGSGKGDRNMVIVPYADRLVLLSRYFQQLVMESLGKELDLDGNVVHQGLNVFGNKGGTDAHAFIQQLNDGRDDFFITFIEVLKDDVILPIDDSTSMGTYLHGFKEGLSAALRSKGRQVIDIRIDEICEYSLGMIIALYERAVAVYAEFININAFHQPGVQAYKLAARSILELREKMLDKVIEMDGFSGTAAALSAEIGMADDEIEIGGLLDKAAINCPDEIVSREYDAEKGWVYTIK